MTSRWKITRRDLLSGPVKGRNLALAGTFGLLWIYVLDKSRAGAHPIRPPGAQEESEFLATCIKCGECVAACPFEVVKLATADDHAAIGTPFLTPREGPCYECTMNDTDRKLVAERRSCAMLARDIASRGHVPNTAVAASVGE